MMIERATDALVVSIVSVAVLWGGSVRPPATLVLAGLAALLLGLIWLRARREQRTVRFAPLAVPLSVGLLIALVQLVPLPPGVRAALAPEVSRVEALVLAGLPHASWRPLTSDFAATVHGALRLATLAVVAISLGSLGRDKRAVLRLALMAATASMVAITALCAAGVPVPAPLAYAGAMRTVARFPFANPNHAAAFLTLTLPLIVVLAVRRTGALRMWAVALALSGNAVLWATLSRAGVLFGTVAQGVALAMVLAPGSGRARKVVAMVVLVLSIGLAVAARPMLNRFSAVAADTRFGVTRDATRMVRDHAVVGAGVGTFSLAFARYSERNARNRFAFVENEYLQVAIDSGVLGALAVLAGLLVGLRWAWRSMRESSPSARAAWVALAALALHNLVDFNFETGGVAVAVCAGAALAFRSAGPRLPGAAIGALLTVLVLLVALGVSSRGRTAEADGARLAESLADPGLAAAEVERRGAAMFVTHPRDGYLAALIAERMLALGDASAFTWLDRALTVSPYDLFVHRILARALVSAGLRDQAAGELRTSLELSDSRERGDLIEEAVSLFARDDDAERLVRLIPDDKRAWNGLVNRLEAHQRWPQLLRVADSLLKRDPADALVIRARLEVGARLKESTADNAERLAQLAEQLVAADRSASALKVAAETLARLGRDARGDELLSAAFESSSRTEAVDLAVLLAERRSARGELDAAAAVLEKALARAVTSGEKARLHRAHATVDERAGRINRAALERAEAARLDRY
jgi:hypothetical protein